MTVMGSSDYSTKVHSESLAADEGSPSPKGWREGSHREKAKSGSDT